MKKIAISVLIFLLTLISISYIGIFKSQMVDSHLYGNATGFQSHISYLRGKGKAFENHSGFFTNSAVNGLDEKPELSIGVGHETAYVLIICCISLGVLKIFAKRNEQRVESTL